MAKNSTFLLNYFIYLNGIQTFSLLVFVAFIANILFSMIVLSGNETLFLLLNVGLQFQAEMGLVVQTV